MTSAAANNGDDDDLDEAGEDERLSAEELCALIGRYQWCCVQETAFVISFLKRFLHYHSLMLIQ